MALRVSVAGSDEMNRCDAVDFVRKAGGVPEWSIGTVLKTVVGASLPWVRIPPPPLPKTECRNEPNRARSETLEPA